VWCHLDVPPATVRPTRPCLPVTSWSRQVETDSLPFPGTSHPSCARATLESYWL